MSRVGITKGQSDIDVTLVNDVKAECRFEWAVKCDWGISGPYTNDFRF